MNSGRDRARLKGDLLDLSSGTCVGRIAVPR